MKFSNRSKIILVILCFCAAFAGFLVKLPTPFRHVDKQMHSLFYFCAAAFLNLLFAHKKLHWHILIFIGLYLFGICIEYAQQYSNTFFHNHIHGRYDPEDVHANLKGLVLFSMVWLPCQLILFLYNRWKSPNVEKESQSSEQKPML